MIAPLLVALVPTIAFPSPGAKLPSVEHVYLVGAVAKGDTNVVVNGTNVDVYRTGAWATLVAVVEGSNSVSVVSQAGEATNVCFQVEKKPAPAADAKGAVEKTWKKLDYAKDEAREPPTNKPPHEVTIVVDPGHGGDDTGAKSPHGFYEKDANLLLSERLRGALAARGYKVVMTREADVFVPLYDRPKTAHAQNADAFVSIHHNAPPCDKDPNVLRYHTVYSWNPIGEASTAAITATRPTSMMRPWMKSLTAVAR